VAFFVIGFNTEVSKIQDGVGECKVEVEMG